MPGTKTVKRILARFAIFLALGVFVAGVSLGTQAVYEYFKPEHKPTIEEKQKELATLLYQGGLAEVLRDNQPDRTLFESGWMDSDFEKETTPYVRVVMAEVTGVLTEEEARSILEKQVRSSLGLGEDESLPADAQQRIDTFIRDNKQADGTLRFRLAETLAQAVLTQNAAVSSTDLVGILQQLTTDEADKVRLKVTVLPNTDLEDDWKNEVVFEGTAKELVNSKDVYLDFENGLAVFRRPADKLLPEPNGYPYNEGDSTKLHNLDAVVYTRNIGGFPTVVSGQVLRVFNEQGFAAISGVFSPQDLGAPVFQVQDGGTYWVGILVNASSDGHVGIMLLREKLQARIPSRIGP